MARTPAVQLFLSTLVIAISLSPSLGALSAERSKVSSALLQAEYDTGAIATKELRPQPVEGIQREAAAEDFLSWMSQHDAPRNVSDDSGERLGNIVMDAARGTRTRYKLKLRTDGAIFGNASGSKSIASLDKKLIPTTNKICQDDQLERWEKRQGMQRIFKVWNEFFSSSYAFAHQKMAEEGLVCLVQGALNDEAEGIGLPVTPSRGSPVLNLIWESRQPICNDQQERFHYYEPKIFFVHGSLADRGKERNVGWVWPEEGTCTPKHKCPIVMFLSGVGEHSFNMSSPAVNNSVRMFKKGFENIHKWGFLRYAERDRDCLSHLGSVIVVPELDRHETWVTHGEELTDHFLLPLLRHMRKANGSILDFKHVSIVGYSEGAFGALQAGVQHPEIFVSVVAASASTSQEWWNSIPMPAKKKVLPAKISGRRVRLRSVILAMGELDTSGVDEPSNLHNALHWLDQYGIVNKNVSIVGLFYASLSHQEVWEHVYNRWQAFHEVYWKGNVRQNFA